MSVRVRRVYEQPDAGDGVRVLVDRLWPRGLSRDRLGRHRWMKEIAPSSQLRRWYGHDPRRFEEFRDRYRSELQTEPWAGLVEELRQLAAEETVTLLTATRSIQGSGAWVLAEFLEVPPH